MNKSIKSKKRFFFTLLAGILWGMLPWKGYAASDQDIVDLTVPASINITFEESGENVISEFVIENNGSSKVRLKEVEVCANNDWHMVEKGQYIPVNTKKLSFGFENIYLMEGMNQIDIELPSNTSKVIGIDVERGAWTKEMNQENAFCLEFGYEIEQPIEKTCSVIHKSVNGEILKEEQVTYFIGNMVLIEPEDIAGYESPQAKEVLWGVEDSIILEYTPIEYKITIDCNGGVGTEEVIYTIESETFTIEKPVRENCIFLGWSGTGLSELIAELVIEKGSIGNISLLANWHGEIDVAYAVYSADDGTLIFYKNKDIVNVGSVYNERIATAVYTGIEKDTYTRKSEVPWYDYNYEINRVIVNDEICPVSMAYWFYYLSFCSYLDVTKINTEFTTNMSNAFNTTGYFESSFMIEGLEGWNVSNVTTMELMFASTGHDAATYDIGDISVWNTQKVKNMKGMFKSAGYKATWLLDLTGWNVKRVTKYTDFNSNVKSKVLAPTFG